MNPPPSASSAAASSAPGVPAFQAPDLSGLVMAMLAALLFAGKAILVKLAYPYGVSPVALLALRMGISAPVFAWVAVTSSRGAPPLTRRDWLWLSSLGVLGYYGASLFDFLGLQYVSAGLERLILFTYPTMTLVMSVFVLGRELRRRDVFALALTWLGIALAFWHDIHFAADSHSVWIGSGFVLLSAFCYAAYLAGCGELVGRLGSQRVSSIATCISAVATLAHFGVTEPIGDLIQPWQVMALSVAMALLSTVLAVFLNIAALRRLGATRTAVVGSIGPVITIALGAVTLGETISVAQIAGTALVVGGVWMAGRR